MKRIIMVICLFMFWGTTTVLGATVSESSKDQAMEKGIAYLQTVQNPDGGFTNRTGGASSNGTTCWVIMAIKAAGGDPQGAVWSKNGETPADFILKNYENLEETTEYARMLMALVAAGNPDPAVASELKGKIISAQKADGHFGQADEQGWINAHMWSIIALKSTGATIPNQDQAKKWLLDQQNDDGGFGWVTGVNSDADDTGIAILTLLLLGEDPAESSYIGQALGFLKNCQSENGGFLPGDDWMAMQTNIATDAWVAGALAAANVDSQSTAWTNNGLNIWQHILSLQKADGKFLYREDVESLPVKMTAYAVIALSEHPYPVTLDYADVRRQNSRLFTDLSENYWAYDEIATLVNRGVLNGYPDGTFKPSKELTRAEFTKFLIVALGLETDSSNSYTRFQDVSDKHWAKEYISLAFDKGYIKGRTVDSFVPDGKIKGSEMAVILTRTLSSLEQKQIVSGSYWYSGAVDYASEHQWLYPNFKTGENANRAQCAYSIYQLVH